MNVYLTYDISCRQDEFKAEMIKNGYFDVWYSSNTKFILPDSSLWKKDSQLNNCLEEVKRTINYLNTKSDSYPIRLLRCIITPVSPWLGIQGEERTKK